MYTRFLYPSKRQWLKEDAQVTIECWHQWVARGDRLFHQQKWRDAVQTLGFSFEAADIMLLNHNTVFTTEESLEKLVLSIVYLSQTYRECNEELLQGYYLSVASQRLERFNRDANTALAEVTHRLKQLVDAPSQHLQFITATTKNLVDHSYADASNWAPNVAK